MKVIGGKKEIVIDYITVLKRLTMYIGQIYNYYIILLVYPIHLLAYDEKDDSDQVMLKIFYDEIVPFDPSDFREMPSTRSAYSGWHIPRNRKYKSGLGL